MRHHVVILILSFLMCSSAQAAKIGAADFSDRKFIQRKKYWAHGLALKKILGFQTVAAALYMPECSDIKNILDDVPKYIELEYLTSIPKVQLDYATIKGISDNVTVAEFAALKSRIDRLVSFYRDVRLNDRIGISYIPEIGTSIFVNHRFVGLIKGADFGKAFFSIWVGEFPVDLAVKDSLMEDYYDDFYGKDWCPNYSHEELISA